MTVTGASQAALFIQNRLGMSPAADSSASGNLTDSVTSGDPVARELGESATTSRVLLLKDRLEEGAHLMTTISVSEETLDAITGYLGEIQTLLSNIEGLSPDSASYQSLRDQIQAKELEMSQYIGSQYHKDAFDVSLRGGNADSLETFLEFANLYEDPDTQSNLLGQVTMIEVEMLEMIEAAHDPNTCPVCASRANNDVAGDVEVVPQAATVTSNTAGTASVSTFSDSSVDTLRSGYQWDLAAGDNLTYSYYDLNADSSNAYTNAGGTYGTTPETNLVSFTAQQESTHENVIDAWDAVLSFSLVEVDEVDGSTNIGDMRFTFTSNDNPERGAYAYYPYTHNPVANGDVVYEPDVSGNFVEGGYNFMTALHEIGHAIGLSHPFGGASASGTSLSAAEDTTRNTFMSYTSTDRSQVLTYSDADTSVTISDYGDHRSVGSITGSYSYNAEVLYVSSPMRYDIAAAEEMYGVETTTNTGDTTHSFDVNPTVIKTIVDSGGTDTFDASNQVRANIIDLTPGAFSSIGIYTQTDQIADIRATQGDSVANNLQSLLNTRDAAVTNGGGTALYTGADNISIAYSTTIENAKGGLAADTITGNAADNTIQGNGGSDTIDGGAGNDTAVFRGQESEYTVTDNGGGSWTIVDSIAGRDGTDTLTNIENVSFLGEARSAYLVTDIDAPDLSSTAESFDISVDGGASVSITLDQINYTSGNQTLKSFASDMQRKINAALAAAGQSARVVVTANSPFSISSTTTGVSSGVSMSNVSSGLASALGIATNGTGWATALTSGAGSTTASALAASAAAAAMGGGGRVSFGGGRSLDMMSIAGARNGLTAVDRAIDKVTNMRSRMGAIENRLLYAISNMTTQSLNMEAAQGRIIDVDMATTSALLMKKIVLSRAASQILGASQKMARTLGQLVG